MYNKLHQRADRQTDRQTDSISRTQALSTYMHICTHTKYTDTE